MRLDRHSLLRALAIGGLSASLGLAALPPAYDFTGHWSGAASSRGASAPLDADFAATANPRTFTGTAALGTPQSSSYVTCDLTARYTRKLKLHLKCSDGSKPRVTAQVDPATQTISGSFPIVGRHGNRHIATFTLMKTSA